MFRRLPNYKKKDVENYICRKAKKVEFFDVSRYSSLRVSHIYKTTRYIGFPHILFYLFAQPTVPCEWEWFPPNFLSL